MRRILFLLTLLRAFLPGTALAWWQPDWAYRKPITVDAGPQGGALKSDAGRTPVLVRLHTGNFSFDGTSENGADLRFVAADEKTVLMIAHRLSTVKGCDRIVVMEGGRMVGFATWDTLMTENLAFQRIAEPRKEV